MKSASHQFLKFKLLDALGNNRRPGTKTAHHRIGFAWAASCTTKSYNDRLLPTKSFAKRRHKHFHQQAAKQPQWRNGGLLGQEHLRCKKRGSHDLSTVFDSQCRTSEVFQLNFFFKLCIDTCTPIYINKNIYRYICRICGTCWAPFNSKSFTVLLHETKENYLCLIPGSCCISPLFIVAP